MVGARVDVLRGTQEMSCLEHKRCPAWNTRDVLLGTHEMSCVEHTRCPAWNTRDVLLGTQEMSCVEQKRCPAWNTRDALLGTQEMSCVRAYVRTYVPLISSTIVFDVTAAGNPLEVVRRTYADCFLRRMMDEFADDGRKIIRKNLRPSCGVRPTGVPTAGGLPPPDPPRRWLKPGSAVRLKPSGPEI